MRFEQIEAIIRREAHGTSFGRDFEWLCKWYLEHAPLYRGKFRKVWRWNEWPERWGRDCGIDLVAETADGKLWAVQCKAVSPEHTVTKTEIDSFLSESNRKQIAYRLLIATTDNIGANALRTIENQARHASVVLRGDLVTTELAWPSAIGGTAPKPLRWKPLPHQLAAIKDVLVGFQKHDRGRLIMACGTGKTLTGLWIHEQTKSCRTLLLVPSISLVQQNLREWGRHAVKDFDCLVVCSDESVASDRDDPAIRHIAELGIDVTTDAGEITAFLAARRRRPAVVIATYQSSDRVSVAQRRAKTTFDLALCDEAHRLVGHVDSHFATVLDDRKIRCRRRLFMTATPRYFTQRAIERAADQELELVSMDKIDKFGPEFHVLTFYDAINAKPTPLLTDYRVVVIGVTNAEAAAWVAEGKLVRTKEGAETDARTLAAQIGLAKAIREYDLRRVITFHRSIKRAARFVDDGRLDSLPAIISKMRPASRPSGKLWARHISGETPAGKRASMLRSLAELPPGTRGLVSNCACLGEGVDVPALDGIAFIDPKGSVVDIIQAVGRVIRLSPDKTIGTIVIPVFIDESTDADHALEQSAFDPVWQVLKALRAHDQRLADELDTLRTSLGKERGGRIRLPANVVLDVPKPLLKDFEQAFYVRAVERVSERPSLTIEQILTWADEYRGRTGAWPTQTSGQIPGTDEAWHSIEYFLCAGRRGLPVGLSIAKLLETHRGKRNPKNLPPLSDGQLRQWIKSFRAQHKSLPNRESGRIPGTKETWANVDAALKRGSRGRHTPTSLADFLATNFRHRNAANLPPLSYDQILAWADAHRRRTSRWPKANSGSVQGTNEAWANVDAALAQGLRELPGRMSLAKLLAKFRGADNRKDPASITLEQVLLWADDFRRVNGHFPNVKSGRIPIADLSWAVIDEALRHGRRGLGPGSSLARVLVEHRKARKKRNLPPLTESQIMNWAKVFYHAHGRWPTSRDGRIDGTEEIWSNVNAALRLGLRKLPGGSSLVQLCRLYRSPR